MNDHDAEFERRARLHGALAEPVRLAVVEELARSDRSPKELGERFGLAANLLAHHLDVLEAAGLVERRVSAGDRRRRYLRLHHRALADLGVATARPAGRVLFVCTHNSARSQLAAALWRAQGGEADSAGTHPAARVHPGAVAAARRAGLDLTDTRPRPFQAGEPADHVVTVCDRAREELQPGEGWRHWSVDDPAERAEPGDFDRALDELRARIRTWTETPNTTDPDDERKRQP